ncbi:hypothetical protein ASD11_00130 [Aeromicrobium sp. Root495]|nr:hypothetical protein ASD11_00130 [Aeromicrobium sp. Root495]
MVTAEMAVIAPFGVVFTFLLAWVVALGLTQVQLTDAAREAARLVARGESVGAAADVARRGAPAGAAVRVERSDGMVTVQVSVRRGLPFLPHVGSRRLEARAVSAQEDP